LAETAGAPAAWLTRVTVPVTRSRRNTFSRETMGLGRRSVARLRKAT
jgi:hypothetical protein